MNKILILFMLFAASNQGVCQINNLPDISSRVMFERDGRQYNDTIPRNIYRENGTALAFYFQKGEKLIREGYFNNGQLKSRAEITQRIGSDTLIYWNYEKKDYEIRILKILGDSPNGEYIDYYLAYKDDSVKIKSQGICKDGLRVGEWTFFDEHRNKIIANFNTDGEFEGKYAEYNFNLRDSTYTLVIEGAFGPRQYDVTYKLRTGERRKYTRKETRRIGTWKYYAKDGKLLEIVEHKWGVEE